jgi:hypothetical protein
VGKYPPRLLTMTSTQFQVRLKHSSCNIRQMTRRVKNVFVKMGKEPYTARTELYTARTELYTPCTELYTSCTELRWKSDRPEHCEFGGQDAFICIGDAVGTLVCRVHTTVAVLRTAHSVCSPDAGRAVGCGLRAGAEHSQSQPSGHHDTNDNGEDAYEIPLTLLLLRFGDVSMTTSGTTQFVSCEVCN